MRITSRHTLATFGIAAIATLGLVGCSSPAAETGSSSESMATTAPAETMAPPAETESTMADPAADLVGEGCAAYAEAVPDGAGSISGMSADPVAVAASNNPLLTTLVAAVSGELNPDVDLVDTLNGSEFTVFAPVDDAFAKIDADTIKTLGTDSELLSKILTYHVVPGQIAPDEIVGEHETVEGSTVTVTGSGDDLKVDDATVICGGVHTANATVYLIDSVLMPAE